MDLISLRKATIDDLSLLEHWDKQQHVIDCDPDSSWNWAQELTEEPHWREQLIAQLNDRPIGMIQIIDPHLEETHYWENVPPNLRAIDIWIGEAEDLNKGYGTRIMKLVIDRCFNNSLVNKILIDPLKSNTKAHRFYERLGFQFVEQRKFETSECFVYELERKTWGTLQ